ncbi:MAG: DegT/DnrJ/EryC1/StrS aminotransferase family protein [Candidatus Rifleibacteriota bacterium]
MTDKAIGKWPHFDKDEILAVQKVLESGKVNYWTGEECRNFEKEFALYLNRKRAISVFNGTVALELALYAFGIGPGDEVIVTCRTFIASAACIILRGAIPVFADIDPESQNIRVDSISEKITPRTKAIICVHLAGWPCDMDPIMKLAKKHNLIVIEDCAQAHGAAYKGKPVGSWGDAATFSFCQDKIITTGGEGGMLVTDDEEIYRKCWSYKDHGKPVESLANKEADFPSKSPYVSFGTNMRMTEMQAAIGRIQLKKLDKWVQIRRNNAERFNKEFACLKALRLTIPPKEFYHSYYKYYFFVKPEELNSGWSRDRIMQQISSAGIPCLSGGYIELYLEKAFLDYFENARKTGAKHISIHEPLQRFPVAQRLSETSLMLQVHPTLTEETLQKTIDVVKKVMTEATRV